MESIALIARKKNDSFLLEQICTNAIEYGYGDLNIFDNGYIEKKKLNGIKERYAIYNKNQYNDSQFAKHETFPIIQNPPIKLVDQASKFLKYFKKYGRDFSYNGEPCRILGLNNKQKGYKNSNIASDDSDIDPKELKEMHENEYTTESETSSSSDEDGDSEGDDEDSGDKHNRDKKNPEKF